MNEEYINVTEAAERFHCSPNNIYYHIKHGTLKTVEEPQKGHGIVHKVKASDIEALIAARDLRKTRKAEKKRQARTLHLYEIILISCGQVSVLFRSCSHKEAAIKYLQLMEHGHKLCRFRVDGEQLTIHESDKLANYYHPRTKKGAAAV